MYLAVSIFIVVRSARRAAPPPLRVLLDGAEATILCPYLIN